MQHISVHFATDNPEIFEELRELLVNRGIQFRWTAFDVETGHMGYGQGEIAAR